MNKNIKKIIGITLAINAVTTILPATFNCGTTAVYASESSYELSSIKLKTSSGSTIKVYDDDNYKSKNEIGNDEMETDTTYYAKTSASTIKFSFSGEDSDNIRIFNGTGSTKGVKGNKSISLSSGSNTITIRVYSEDPGSSVKYKGDEDYEVQYKIKVKCTASDSDNDEDSISDDIYLKNITLSDGEINFSKKTNSYNINVESLVDEITIKAAPEDEDYSVSINDRNVDEDDKWKKTINLNNGNNKVVIVVSDDDDNERRYTLNIARGNISNTSDNVYLDILKVGSTSLKLSEDKKNYNILVSNDISKILLTAEPKDTDYTITIDGTKITSSDNFRKYVEIEDDIVNVFKIKVRNTNGTEQVYTLNIGKKNVPASKYPVITSENISSTNSNNSIGKWINDSSCNYSYINTDGSKATGWLELNKAWYYLGSDGIRTSGWQYISGKWYYMDTNGVMLTGWFRSPYSGKDYYLNPLSNGSKGAMVVNTVVDGKRISSDGTVAY